MSFRFRFRMTILLGVAPFLSCSETEPRFTSFYWVDEDTVAVLRVPEGYSATRENLHGFGITRLAYPDSSLISLAYGIPDSIPLLGPGTYSITSSRTDSSNLRYPTPVNERELFGRMRGRNGLLDELKIIFEGRKQMRVLYSGFSKSDIMTVVQTMVSLRPYVAFVDRMTFLDTTRYVPMRHEVEGDYSTLTKSGGPRICIRSDKTYLYSLSAPHEDTRAFYDSGSYSVRLDTLELFGRLQAVYDSTSSNLWYHQKSHVYYLFKRIGPGLFLVPSWRMNDFAQAAIEQGGVPTKPGDWFDAFYLKAPEPQGVPPNRQPKLTD